MLMGLWTMVQAYVELFAHVDGLVVGFEFRISQRFRTSLIKECTLNQKNNEPPYDLRTTPSLRALGSSGL